MKHLFIPKVLFTCIKEEEVHKLLSEREKINEIFTALLYLANPDDKTKLKESVESFLNLIRNKTDVVTHLLDIGTFSLGNLDLPVKVKILYTSKNENQRENILIVLNEKHVLFIRTVGLGILVALQGLSRQEALDLLLKILKEPGKVESDLEKFVLGALLLLGLFVYKVFLNSNLERVCN